jgi:hypothetical protein
MIISRPILFSTAMVRAILAGEKTQTRRVVKHARHNGCELLRPLPSRWNVGDRLWVRESFCPRCFDDGKPAFKANWDGKAADCVLEPKWKPSIHMPRALSRITLVVTDLRVQPLQQITEEDACAESCRRKTYRDGRGVESAVVDFRNLWDSINGKRAGCLWADNPLVWALTFEVAP